MLSYGKKKCAQWFVVLIVVPRQLKLAFGLTWLPFSQWKECWYVTVENRSTPLLVYTKEQIPNWAYFFSNMVSGGFSWTKYDIWLFMGHFRVQWAPQGALNGVKRGHFGLVQKLLNMSSFLTIFNMCGTKKMAYIQFFFIAGVQGVPPGGLWRVSRGPNWNWRIYGIWDVFLVLFCTRRLYLMSKTTSCPPLYP